jgi:hypothetical protein
MANGIASICHLARGFGGPPSTLGFEIPVMTHSLIAELVLFLSKGRSIGSYIGWRAPEQSAQGPVHVALVAKPSLIGDGYA